MYIRTCTWTCMYNKCVLYVKGCFNVKVSLPLFLTFLFFFSLSFTLLAPSLPPSLPPSLSPSLPLSLMISGSPEDPGLMKKAVEVILTDHAPHPLATVRQAACIWLLCLLKHSSQHPSLQVQNTCTCIYMYIRTCTLCLFTYMYACVYRECLFTAWQGYILVWREGRACVVTYVV